MSKLKEGDRISWDVLQSYFARRQRLPHGTEFELVHRKTANGGERLARSTQKKVTLGKFHGIASDDETLNDLIWNRLAPSLVDPPSRDEFHIRIKGPNGERVKGTNFSVGRIRREWPGQPTPAEIQAEIELEAGINEVCNLVNFRDIEDGCDPDVVLRGILRKLIIRFGPDDVQSGLDEENTK